ncbi:ATP-dependent 6-phosphofructokinase [Egibacter rhizosphaerae]|uniref:ATP-dependent 6-phosphofructokinase n=1 Tax=Egibacter rhizosphaerae TaxID=1670831 RepID=A0A411YE02_9ACTN|nr:ATP-dependent 6-phosphofructokinase [Egibacter rhizosphaerae]QBI19428.1 ATP-dependent 6-phosphofructokinase [Egibacter rhizosphaerae]
MRTIAVLTSGGDSPGMNAAIRAVVRAADAHGIRTMRVASGFAGLVDGDVEPITSREVSGILHLGGTFLGTARSSRFRTTEGRREAQKHLDLAEVDGLVVIGGDGSFRGADALSREGPIRVVGVPGTIDNDLAGTDWTLGFDTAVNTALESIDRIRDTAASHGRLFFIEVMGRHSGWISLYCGLAGGATHVLLPETPTDVRRVREDVQRAFDLGKQFCLVVVAEGDQAGGAFSLADRVVEGLRDVDHRVTALGHIQRGGSPTMRDRVLGSLLGDAAVEALLDGDDRVMVGERKGRLERTPLSRSWTDHEEIPEPLISLMDRLAR